MTRLPAQLTYNDLNGQEAVDILCDWFAQLLRSQPAFQPHLTLPMAKFTLAVTLDVDMYIGGSVPVESPPERLTATGNVALSNAVAGGPQMGPLAVQAGQPQHQAAVLQTVVNAAPIPGGVPPDQLREQHGLPVPRPGFGPRDTGSHLFLADIPDVTEPSRTGGRDGGRSGEVAPGYVFAQEPVPPVPDLQQDIPVGSGSIEIDLSGAGRMRQGDTVVTAGTHRASAKEQGDQRGAKYGSVAGTYDPGPAGLAQPGRSGGLYSDGRSRVSFGNNR